MDYLWIIIFLDIIIIYIIAKYEFNLGNGTDRQADRQTDTYEI